MDLGLVSISFRGLTAEQIMQAVKNAGLTCVEWGSDVHAPYNAPEKLAEIVALQQQYGVDCSSYGTYFWLGWDDIAQLPDYICAAKKLGTNILRLWCGKRDPDSILPEEKEKLFADCKAAAALGVNASAAKTKKEVIALLETAEAVEDALEYEADADEEQNGEL